MFRLHATHPVVDCPVTASGRTLPVFTVGILVDFDAFGWFGAAFRS